MAKPKQMPTPIETAYQRRAKLLTQRGYVSLFLRLGLIVLAVYLIFSQVFMLYRCNDQYMFPSVKAGDLVLAFRLEDEYLKDDMVIYSVAGAQYIGRIAAKETDMVVIDNSGNLIVNGTTQGGEIMYPTFAKEGITYPLRVPEDSMFLLGDFRTQTRDSRDFGPIPASNIHGKVITVIRWRGL